MKTFCYLLLILACIIMSCGSAGNEKKDGNAEVPGVAVGESTSMNVPKDTVGTNKKDSSKPEASKADTATTNEAALTGLWLTPHAATVRIQFFADSTFTFDDYNTKLQRDEKLIGRYRLSGSTLTLLYHDRPQQNFKFQKGEGKDPNYYITRPGYYFVKTDSQ